MFQNQVVNVWAIVYDQDARKIYTFTDWQRVLQAVDGSIRSYLDCPMADATFDKVIEDLRECHDRNYIPIKVNNLIITIYRWELDSTNPLHRVLSKCYEVVNDEVKLEIMSLFSNGG